MFCNSSVVIFYLQTVFTANILEEAQIFVSKQYDDNLTSLIIINEIIKSLNLNLIKYKALLSSVIIQLRI